MLIVLKGSEEGILVPTVGCNAKLFSSISEYEVNLLRLIDKLTNGTTLEVNETGTNLVFQPGILVGGAIQHECCKERGIGYYLEVCLAFAPFCKKGLQITLRGVTNNQVRSITNLFSLLTLIKYQ